MNAGYSNLTVDLKSANEIYKAITKKVDDQDQGDQEAMTIFNITGDDLHATLMYDKRDPAIYVPINNKRYKAKIVGVERLGNQHGNHYACVLLLDAPAVQKRHKELLELGFQHTFDELKLHISLNYGAESEILFARVKRAFDEGLLPEEIILANECWNPCKD